MRVGDLGGVSASNSRPPARATVEIVPKRTRPHRLEDISRRRFAEALGEDYLVRGEVPDYAIDGGVEEFGPDDEPTGLRYLTQLKATDASGPDALAVAISVDKATYYGSLSLPVLMVRYVVQEDRLFVRWWHGLQLGGGAPAEDQQSITFRWQESDEMTAETPPRLAEEARSYLALRSSMPPLPLAFHLEVEGDEVLRVAPAELALALRSELGPRSDVIDLHRQAPPGNGRFLVRDRRLAVGFPGMIATS